MFVSELERLVDEQKDSVLLVYPQSTIVPFSSNSEIPVELTWETLRW